MPLYVRHNQLGPISTSAIMHAEYIVPFPSGLLIMHSGCKLQFTVTNFVCLIGRALAYHISNLTVVPPGKWTEWLMNAAPTVTLLEGSNCPRT